MNVHLRCFGQVRVPTAVIGTPSAGVKEVTTGKEVRRGLEGHGRRFWAAQAVRRPNLTYGVVLSS